VPRVRARFIAGVASALKKGANGSITMPGRDSRTSRFVMDDEALTGAEHIPLQH
jgi:hypothetical protein